MTSIDTPDYARTVTFHDGYNHDAPDALPVHVTNRIHIDGQPVPGVVAASLAFGKSEATIVTLDVMAEHVAVPFVGSDGQYVHAAIGEHLLLVPPLPDHPWELVEASPAPNYSSHYPLWEGDAAVVRCHFYVGRVLFE